MSEERHGFFGTVIKIIMVIVFFLIGGALVALGSVYIAKGWDGQYRWLSICNIVFGCLLLTSPFFLNRKRAGLNWIIKILMTIIFVLFGLTLIIVNSIALAQNWFEQQYRWYPIVNLVLGCLLFTSPFFLKK